MATLIDETVVQVRRIASALRPPLLDPAPLVPGDRSADHQGRDGGLAGRFLGRGRGGRGSHRAGRGAVGARESNAQKPIFLTGSDMLKFLEEDDALNKNLMTEAGFVAN